MAQERNYDNDGLNPSSAVDELKKYAALRDKGIITEEEYRSKRWELLDELLGTDDHEKKAREERYKKRRAEYRANVKKRLKFQNKVILGLILIIEIVVGVTIILILLI